ncbi:MAG: PLP-dependent aminotransferase family protein, partial [Hyphomicrobiales bacterium]
MPREPNATLVSVALDPKAAGALYVQLFEQARDLILEGRLKPRQRLPSSRALARDLGVSRTTTLAAYEQLASEGYIEGRAGSGIYVASELPEDLLSARGPIVGLGPGAAQAPAAPTRPAAAPFDAGMPETRGFPFAEWSRQLGRSWRTPSADMLHLTDPAGHLPLRQAIADYLRDMRGLECAADQIFVTASAAQSIAIVARTLLGPGDRVLVEDPCYPAARRALVDAGADVVPVAVDADGFAPQSIPAQAQDARAAIVTPSRHYPLGMTMPLARRLDLLNWADRRRGWIVEDDYDSEYRYVGRPLSALMSLDRSGTVIYLGSFSKIMFRALRLGYVVAPMALVPDIRATLGDFGPTASALAQPALAGFMASGHLAAHIRRMRRLYADRQKALTRALETHLAGLLSAPSQNAG